MKNAAYAHLPGALRALLHQMVFAQDAGYPLAEELTKERFELSLIDRLAVQCDTERLRMRHAGIPVYIRVGNEPLILGLNEKPFKQPHQCIQHDAKYETTTIPDPAGPEGKTMSVDICYCRFCGTVMPMKPEEDSLASED